MLHYIENFTKAYDSFSFEIILKESFICAHGNCKKAVGEGSMDCMGNFAIASSALALVN